MKETKAKDISVLWLEEIKRSHHVLQKLIAALPVDTRTEFIGLLRVLAEGDESHDSFPSAQEKAHRIVADLCRENQGNEKSEPYESERRAGDRRKQNRRQAAGNSHKLWTAEQMQTLQSLVEQKVPILRIARKLGRTSAAIESKAKEIKLPLSQIK